MDTYEKKYNEALERFKSFKEKYYTKDTNLGDVIFDKTGEMQKDFEEVFPELRESEDERIRKAVVSLVYEMKGTYQSFAKVELDKMVAWLEKQKERGPLTKEEEYTLQRIIEYLEDAMDITGMSEEEILSSEEVFAIGDGRYLIVEG